MSDNYFTDADQLAKQRVPTSSQPRRRAPASKQAKWNGPHGLSSVHRLILVSALRRRLRSRTGLAARRSVRLRSRSGLAHPTRTPIAPWIAAVVGLTIIGCDTPRLMLPSIGTKTAAEVPLNLLWETELSTKSSCGLLPGCPGPYSPQRTVVECLPADRCKATTIKRPDHPRLLLSVVGITAGPATVSIRYQQPESQSWLAAALQVNFVPEERGTPLELGRTVPVGAGILSSLEPALEANGFSAPARCEPQDEFRESFTCFDLEESAGQRRYPSCRHTLRCETSRSPYSGFFAQIQYEDNAITSIGFRADVPYVGEITASRDARQTGHQP